MCHLFTTWHASLTVKYSQISICVPGCESSPLLFTQTQTFLHWFVSLFTNMWTFQFQKLTANVRRAELMISAHRTSFHLPALKGSQAVPNTNVWWTRSWCFTQRKRHFTEEKLICSEHAELMNVKINHSVWGWIWIINLGTIRWVRFENVILVSVLAS